MGCSCCKNNDGGEHFDVMVSMPEGDNCDCCNNSKDIMKIQNAMTTCSNMLNELAMAVNEIREKVELKIKKIDERAIVPQYQHEGDAGFDFTAIIDHRDAMGEYSETVEVAPGEKYIVSTGLSMAVPKGYELQVRPRSGLAYKSGITVINSPGTVDSGYRGEVKVILLNTGASRFKISTGDRIAQGVINKLPTVSIREVDELDETERGTGGFGSTGR
jgi:dUTP pyrophosphatase